MNQSLSSAKDPYDDRIICPVSGEALFLVGQELVTADGRHTYKMSDGILPLFIDPAAERTHQPDQTTGAVQAFYTQTPFPNYNEFDNIKSFVRRANQGVFARLLREQIPANSDVLEVGCGTGQMSNFLAATSPARIYATDMTLASLKLGMDFAKRNKIGGITFAQMNLFHPCIKPQSMDIVISLGVLHHTADTRAAFLSVARLVKPGGYIILGLYNKIGRLRTDLRRHLYKAFGEKVLFLDPHLRNNLSEEKRKAWISDQYEHPQERKHTMTETLSWFSEAGFDFVSSIPKIASRFSADEKLFEPTDPQTGIARTMTEIEMLFTRHGGEGGLYIMIGRKT